MSHVSFREELEDVGAYPEGWKAGRFTQTHFGRLCGFG